jgi:DNA-binding transcriptional ArsR family regulator
MPPKPAAPTLSWPVHRDLAYLLAHWRVWIQILGRDPFGLLLILESLRLEETSGDTFRYRDLETAIGVSPPTLRRWIASLRTAGLLSTSPVPGTNRTEATFEIHVVAPPPTRTRTMSRRRGPSPSSLTAERTSRQRR